MKKIIIAVSSIVLAMAVQAQDLYKKNPRTGLFDIYMSSPVSTGTVVPSSLQAIDTAADGEVPRKATSQNKFEWVAPASGDAVLAATQTWTGGNTLNSWTTFGGSVTANGDLTIGNAGSDLLTINNSTWAVNSSLIDIDTTTTGTGKSIMRMDLTNGEVIFNDDAADRDFRIEDSAGGNILFVDAGLKKVLIGNDNTKTPLGQLELRQNGSNFGDGIVLQRNGNKACWNMIVGGDKTLYYAFADDGTGCDNGADFSTIFTITSAGNVSVTGTLAVTGTSAFTGAITPSGGIVGTTSAGNATAGNYGEYTSSAVTVFTNFAATTAFGNVAQLSLTAGDWELTGVLTAKLNGAVMTDFQTVISSYSANTTTDHVQGQNWLESAAVPVGAINQSACLAGVRVTLAGTTTMYLKGEATYASGNPQYVGILRARRQR